MRIDLGNGLRMFYLTITLCLVSLVHSIGLSAMPSDTTLFTLLDPSKTQIYFNNIIEDKKEHSILLYSNYYGGGGVGIGDINNDGLQDVYFAGNLVGDRLYLNKGDFVFEDITQKAGIFDNGGWSSGVLFGDINEDGFVDIYVTRELYDERPELRKNKLYINNGDNTFTESAARYGLDDDQRTRHATFLDYDKDGDIDLFLCNQPPNPGDYSKYYKTELLLDEYTPKLMENQGEIFIDVTEKAGLKKTGFPNSVSASDFNNDGWTDLWLANDYWVGDYLYYNNGDGTFSNVIHEKVPHITFSSMGIDAGDINNDGHLDVMILDMVVEDHARRHRNMGGMNTSAFEKVVNEGGHYQYFTNTLFLNRGNGYFSDIVELAGISSTDWSWSHLLVDLDNDGWKDVFIANGLMRDIRDYDGQNNFKNVIAAAIQQYVMKNPDLEKEVSIWDIVDMDKVMNIAPSVKVRNYTFRNNRDLTFDDTSVQWGIDRRSFSNGAAYADLDNDGDLDLVVNNVNDTAFIYRNNSESLLNNHYLRIKVTADENNKTELGTRIYIDSESGSQMFEITSVRGMYSTSENIVHFGLGKDQKVDVLKVVWPNGRIEELKNIKAGQTVEVFYSRSKPEKTKDQPSIEPIFKEVTRELDVDYKHVENIFDDFSRQILAPYKMSELGPPLATGDINGDGLQDFFIGGSAGTEGVIYTQNADGRFDRRSTDVLFNDKIHEDIGAVMFDVDNDEDLDLYVVSGGNEFRPRSPYYQDRLYLNDGSGNFTRSENWLPKFHISGSKALPYDIDSDGDLDLLVTGRHIPWSYPDPESSTLLINQGDHFEDKTHEVAPGLRGIGMVNDAVFTDLNGDSLIDFVLAGEWMPVSIFLNENGNFTNKTDDAGLGKKTGWWFSIESADMDSDGDMDLIAGNFGTNSKYSGTSEEPFEVFYFDFDNNGLKDIVLAYNEGDRKLPYRRKKDASSQVPFIDDKFKTFGAYAEADIYEIYGKEFLENALHYEANTFESIYIENLGNGKFKSHILPVEAQFSSVNDILIDDYNHDGHKDILIAGNMYVTEVRTPRNDAGIGLLLTGDGTGHFESLSYTESGFFVPYDVKNMSRIKGKKNEIILVGCNNSYLKIFRVNRNGALSQKE